MEDEIMVIHKQSVIVNTFLVVYLLLCGLFRQWTCNEMFHDVCQVHAVVPGEFEKEEYSNWALNWTLYQSYRVPP